MSKLRTSGVHDIGFFRNIGISLVVLALTAGSITLGLALNNESSASSSIIANLAPSVGVESQ